MTRQSARLTVLQNKQETAQASLEELKAELPRFHSLLTDNERDAERLRRDKASLDDQAQAKGRVNVAREMLEQHQADISSAQAEVDRLTAEVEREQGICDASVALATVNDKKAHFDKVAKSTGRQLVRLAQQQTEALDELIGAVRAFERQAGAEIAGELAERGLELPTLPFAPGYFTDRHASMVWNLAQSERNARLRAEAEAEQEAKRRERAEARRKEIAKEKVLVFNSADTRALEAVAPFALRYVSDALGVNKLGRVKVYVREEQLEEAERIAREHTSYPVTRGEHHAV